MTSDTAGFVNDAKGTGLVKAQKENIIEKSLDKLKETTTVCILYIPFWIVVINFIIFYGLPTY